MLRMPKSRSSGWFRVTYAKSNFISPDKAGLYISCRQKMANLSRGKDMRNPKNFFSRVLSEIKPSSLSTVSEIPKSPHNSKPKGQPKDEPRSLPSSPTTNNAEQRCLLLALPTEIRLQIYDLLLVSRLQRGEGPPWAVGNTGQKVILLHDGYKCLAPAILRTCRQIYKEAIPILYSQNVFFVGCTPAWMFRLMAQCGPRNVRSIRSVVICVPPDGILLKWALLLGTLSKEATGLRFMELEWTGRGWRWDDHAVMFVRVLARIQQLETLTISGYYAQHSESYLKREMSAVRVHASYGYPSTGARPDDENLSWLSQFKDELEAQEDPEWAQYRVP